MLDNIKLKSLTEEEIVSKEYSLESLWILKYSDKQIGPFHTSQLKEASQESHEIFESIEATNLLKNNFIGFFQNIEFQRRKPALVQSSSLVKDSNFFILKNGQKAGPFDFDELEDKINEREVSLGDLLSVDKGQTWIKIYEHHQFDRRARAKGGDLPFSPDESLVQEAIRFGKESLIKAQKKKEEEDAIVGLAFLSHGHEHAKKAEEFKSHSWVSASKPSKKFNVKIAATFAFVIMISFGTFLSGKSKTGDSLKHAATKNEAINNTNRNVKRLPASTSKAAKKLVANKGPEPKRTATPSKYRSLKAKKKVTKIKRERPQRYIPKKEPQRITHFADEFDDRIDNDSREEDSREEETREPASVDEPNFYPEDELTQEQIEAIELGDPDLLEKQEQHY